MPQRTQPPPLAPGRGLQRHFTEQQGMASPQRHLRVGGESQHAPAIVIPT